MAGDAIIFIPGIKGTKLVETNLPTWDTIWSGIQSNFETIEDLELTASYKGRYFEEKPRSIIQPSEIETLAYGEFLRDLHTELPIYIFNYDWRLSARHNGGRLAAFTDYLIDKSKARNDESKRKYRHPQGPIKQFDFITHSLGNFILRHYISKFGFDRINKIVFTVPPFRGSLDIVSAAVIGEGFFPGVKSKLRKFIRTMPGALELLPDYVGASRFDDDGAHSFFKFKDWQGNIVDAEGPIAEKMMKALRLAKVVVRKELCDLASLKPEERSRILVIARGGYDTWQSISVKKNDPGNPRNFVDFDNAQRTKDGDGRVPHVSSCWYWDSIQTVMLEHAFWYRDYSHGFVLKDERLQRLVNRYLFGDGPFDSSMPGGSVKRVTGLNRKTDRGEGLPWWEVETA